MNTILSGLQGLQCFVYLDAIVIYASSIEELLRPYFLFGARFLKEFIFLSAFELVLGLTLWDS